MTDALRRHRRFLMGLFIAAAAFLYLAHIGSYHLIDLDEGRYHRVAMEMVLSGDYITPHFDYMPYFEKPIFQYWVTALSMELFGIREFTGRILPALTGLGNVFLAFWLAKTMYNQRTGLLAAVIVATSALQLIVASIGVMDMALTFFIDACLVSFYVFERTENKKYLLVFYAAMGFGMLTKGLIAIVFPFGILFWYALLSKRPRLFLKLFYLPGIILFLVIAVPWYYLVCDHFLRIVCCVFHSCSSGAQLRCVAFVYRTHDKARYELWYHTVENRLGTWVIGSACLVFGYCLACRSVYGENGHTGRGLYKRRYELRKEQLYLIDLSLCEKICRYLRYIGSVCRFDMLRNAGELRHYVIFVLCKELRRLLADSYYLRHIFIAVSLLYQLQYIGVVTACKTSVARNYNEQTVLYLSVSCIYGA